MEYRSRIDEMKDLVDKKKVNEALEVADSINWRKVHNINELLSGSEAYEAAGQLEDARDLLLLAHERSPIGRTILYRLSMLSIKLGDLDAAQGFYNDYVQIAPHDSLKYILKYNINIARGADTNTIIKILEQLKEQDFMEEWAYELAYLYHKNGMSEKCIDLCDEIILWFGDGPYVERALELKMIYQPLDKTQEDKYRHLQQRKDGITEIVANEPLQSGEVVAHTVTIPSVELPPERFNTVNLQAEIKKSIEEIMKATEAGEVVENMDAIKSLVEEIPYLQVPEEEKESEPELEPSESINEKFKGYLEEEYDGQISFFLPDEGPQQEEQIAGQMTIEDVMAEWEKTRRAAEAALNDAKEQEFLSTKAKALKEANHVLNRLEEAMPMLDAGMTSAELLKQEYLSSRVKEEIDNKQEFIPSLEDISAGFAIPKVDAAGVAAGTVTIPVVRPEAGIQVLEADNREPAISKNGVTLDTTSWTPPALEEKEEEPEQPENSEAPSNRMDVKQAAAQLADVNRMLQDEIDRLTSEVPKEPELPQIEMPMLEEALETEPVEEELVEPEVTEPLEEIHEEIQEETQEDETLEIIEPEPVPEPVQELVLDTEDEVVEEEAALTEEEPFDIALPEISLDGILDDIPEPVKEEMAPEPEPVEEIPEVKIIEPEEILEVKKVDLQEKPVERQVIVNDPGPIKLDDEDIETFSYFMPLSGMKDNITRTINAVAPHILGNMPTEGGNIIIQGEKGTGKTQMATSLVKTLQRKTGKPEGGVGRIDAQRLNQKDLHDLFEKIQGGCLIIEKAGNISKETALTLSLLLAQDTKGTLVIMEDNKRGIENALMKDASFARRFTEKIVIPVFSMDELVDFGKTYAAEAGFSIDEMGVLAMYNRINLIGKYDHATSIKEVADIMDEAIAKSQKVGFFGKRKNNTVLREKDFDK